MEIDWSIPVKLNMLPATALPDPGEISSNFRIAGQPLKNSATASENSGQRR
jgi:hypothetical protein